MLPAPVLCPPPAELGAFERDLWARLMPRVQHLAHVDRRDIPTASVFVSSTGYYLRLTRRLRELKAAHTGPAALDMVDAELEAARWRRTAREAAADFGLLPAKRVGLALVDAAGEDVELKRIFGLEIGPTGTEVRT